MLGHVTSSYRGTVGSFALALVSGGMEREGQRLYAVDSGHAVPVLVTDPTHITVIPPVPAGVAGRVGG